MTEPTENPLILSKLTTTIDQLPIGLFLSRLLKSAAALLILGMVGITLYTFQDMAGNMTDVLPDQVDPASVAGGAAILVALTLMGVPILPAAIASLSIWWLIQDLIA